MGLGAAITRRDGRLDENRTVTSSVRAEFGQLPPDDAAVLANADRGFIGTLESPKITAPDGPHRLRHLRLRLLARGRTRDRATVGVSVNRYRCSPATLSQPERKT